MKRAVAISLCLLYVACGGTDVTQPTKTETPPPTAPNTVGTPTAVNPPAGSPKDVEAWIKAGGQFYAKNLTAAPAHFVFYTTSFDKQTYTPGDPKQEMIVQPNDFFAGSFNTKCRQVDGAFNSTDGRIFVSAYINHLGVPVPADQIDRLACNLPGPTPTPSPSPSPTPTPQPSPTPTPKYCYYEPDCGNQLSFNTSKTTACPDSSKANLCTAKNGVWSNWYGHGNHCRIPFPGVSLGNFQLNPGQSAAGCLSKHDD